MSFPQHSHLNLNQSQFDQILLELTWFAAFLVSMVHLFNWFRQCRCSTVTSCDFHQCDTHTYSVTQCHSVTHSRQSWMNNCKNRPTPATRSIPPCSSKINSPTPKYQQRIKSSLFSAPGEAADGFIGNQFLSSFCLRPSKSMLRNNWVVGNEIFLDKCSWSWKIFDIWSKCFWNKKVFVSKRLIFLINFKCAHWFLYRTY